MPIDELDYDLPEELIAQEPPPVRGTSRLLVLDRQTGAVSHHSMGELPGFLKAHDCLVVNDTRVLPARLNALRESGGRVEIFLLEERDDGRFEALVKSGGAPQEGETLHLLGGGRITLVRSLGQGHYEVAGVGEDMRALMEAYGRMPLPPYIRREATDERDAMDRERYQTVFAREAGAVAAPTAGLHLTAALLAEVEERGVRQASLTLHVGLGTFAPVRAERLEDHEMHDERYQVTAACRAAVARARQEGGRVVAVGTTSVRALEAAAAGSGDGLPAVGSSRTDLLIAPGHAFRVVEGLLTNFHLPRSTLLALVGAFAGLESVMAAYSEAVRERYRFYSYGDAMLIL